MNATLDQVVGRTFHGRKGAVQNDFSYAVDYVLIDPDRPGRLPALFARNSRNLTSLHDSDHGGAPGQGHGLAWVRDVLAAQGIALAGPILLLAQPRVLGHVFNPVSFWLCHDRSPLDAAGPAALRVVIAEVSNTFGDRHAYLCHHDDLGPIQAEDHLAARKILHVSPFQAVTGGYIFRFDIGTDRIGIWIDYTAGSDGVIATLTGRRRPLTNRAILLSCLLRPFGSRRVLGLIHWQALRLYLKGARYRSRPSPPSQKVSR